MAKKFYAVRSGRKPGIYETWDECKSMVCGFKGAEYKSFSTKEEAMLFLKKERGAPQGDHPDAAVAYVDGSYAGARKKYAYGCVILYRGERHELSGSGADPEYLGMRNVAGEILASMKAVTWAIEHQAAEIAIYYDYAGIEMWAEGLWKTNRTGTEEYRRFMADAGTRVKIRFVKVAAHTGVELNERADALAKAALSGAGEDMAEE